MLNHDIFRFFNYTRNPACLSYINNYASRKSLQPILKRCHISLPNHSKVFLCAHISSCNICCLIHYSLILLGVQECIDTLTRCMLVVLLPLFINFPYNYVRVWCKKKSLRCIIQKTENNNGLKIINHLATRVWRPHKSTRLIIQLFIQAVDVT